MNLIHVANLIYDACREADVSGNADVVLNFHTERDLYRFKASLQRSLRPIDLDDMGSSFHQNVFKLHGIIFRLASHNEWKGS